MRQRRESGFDAYQSNLRDAAGNAVDRGTVVFDDGGIVRRLSMTPVNFIGLPTGIQQGLYQGQLLANLNRNCRIRAAGGFNDTPRNWYVTPGSAATLQSGAGSYTNTINKAVYGNFQTTYQRETQGGVFGVETRHDRARTGAQPIANYALRENQGAFETFAQGRAINQAVYGQYQRVMWQRTLWPAGGGTIGERIPAARRPQSTSQFAGSRTDRRAR